MIKYMASFMVIMLISGCASMSVADPNLNYQKTYEQPGKSKEDIYSKALQWLARTYNDSKAVIEYQNEEEGKIIGRGISEVTFNPTLIAPITHQIQYTITIDIKENKIRITYDNFKNLDAASFFNDSFNKLQPQLVELSEELNKYINSEVDSEW